MISRRPSWLAVAAFVVLTGVITCEEQIKLVKEGENAVLECRGEPTIGCVWTGDNNFYISTLDPDSAPPRYTISSNYANGDCSLSISSTALNDTNHLICRVNDPRKTVVRWYLTVGNTPMNPVIYFNKETNPIDVNIPKEIPPEDSNNLVNLSCVVENAIPKPAIMTWSGDVGPYPHNIEYDATTRKAINVLTLDFSQQNEAKITCTVEHDFYEKERTREVTVIVGKRHPTDTVDIVYREGASHAMCEGNGIPRPDEFLWQFRVNEDQEWKDIYHAANITLEETGHYICSAKNAAGGGLVNSRNGIHFKRNGGIIVEPNAEASNTQQAGMIVGIVIAALVVICIIAGLTLFTFRRKMLCFQDRSHRPGVPENVENGGKIQTINSPDGKPDVKGDQNENTKQKEIVYAQLNLPQSQGNHSPKSPKEKTEYAQIKFQPKENQV